jgi:hypothetical protein
MPTVRALLVLCREKGGVEGIGTGYEFVPCAQCLRFEELRCVVRSEGLVDFELGDLGGHCNLSVYVPPGVRSGLLTVRSPAGDVATDLVCTC